MNLMNACYAFRKYTGGRNVLIAQSKPRVRPLLPGRELITVRRSLSNGWPTSLADARLLSLVRYWGYVRKPGVAS